jgi:hypothetical protein
MREHCHGGWRRAAGLAIPWDPSRPQCAPTKAPVRGFLPVRPSRSFTKRARVQITLWQLSREKSLIAKRSDMKGNSSHTSKANFGSAFVSSNPPTPASQCGLSYSISGCSRTADIPAGYAGVHESLAGKFRTFGSGLVALAAPVSARHFPISVSECPRPVRH